MIKRMIGFVKNLFTKEQPSVEPVPTASWPFPTSVPQDGSVDTPAPVEVVSDVEEPEVTAPKSRKRRNLRKKVTSAATTTTAVATPVEPTKEEVKLSPGPSRRRKSKK